MFSIGDLTGQGEALALVCWLIVFLVDRIGRRRPTVGDVHRPDEPVPPPTFGQFLLWTLATTERTLRLVALLAATTVLVMAGWLARGFIAEVVAAVATVS